MAMYVTYVVAALCAALFLSSKTDRKALGFILIFWILAQPVLMSKFIIDLPGMPFDLQPNRILFLILLPYLFFASIFSTESLLKQDVFHTRPPFEKYFYIYLVIVTASLAYNYDQIRWQSMTTIPVAILTFITVYLVGKRFITQLLFEAIIKSIILLSIVGATIAIIQIFMDNTFLKTGEPRLAFGSVDRATGVFMSEYALGYFQILAIMIALSRYRGSFWRYCLIPLLVISTLLTFHRLSVIILVVCVFIYLWLLGNLTSKAVTFFAMVFSVVLTLAVYNIVESSIENTALVQERLQQNTVTGRFHQYRVVASSIVENSTFTGMGDYSNKAYDKLMGKHNMLQRLPNGDFHGIRIHNGFLQVGLLYGIFAMATFLAILFSMLWYFKKDIALKEPYRVIPFFAVLIWALANVSNGVSFFGIYFVVLIAMLSGASVTLGGNDLQEVSGGDTN